MTWMDFKMADTSERKVFCNTILLKYHGMTTLFRLAQKAQLSKKVPKMFYSKKIRTQTECFSKSFSSHEIF